MRGAVLGEEREREGRREVEGRGGEKDWRGGDEEDWKCLYDGSFHLTGS